MTFYDLSTKQMVWRDDPNAIKGMFSGLANIGLYRFSREGKILAVQRTGLVVHAIRTCSFDSVFSKVGDGRFPTILTLPTPHPTGIGD